MNPSDVTIAVFDNHLSADAAVKALTDGGFPMTSLSVVGQGYHTEEKVVGFYNVGNRIAFWGSRGAFWGGLWGFFLGGVFLSTPLVGPIVVVGYLVAAVISGLEGAAVVGGLGALGAALFSLGAPKDTAIKYEEAVKADRFFVMAHGSAEDMARAKSVLAARNPSSLETHQVSHLELDALAEAKLHVNV